MSHPRCGVRSGFLVLALLVLASTAGAQQQPAIEFEDPDLPAREKEYFQRWSTTVRAWAMVQRVVAEVRERNAEPLTPDRVREIDAAWRAGRDPDNLRKKLTSNPCALALQSVLSSHTSVSEIFVTDARGALVCATGSPPAFDEAGEARFQKAMAEGRGAIFVSRARAGESAGGAEVVQVSVPVLDGGRAVGVLTVVQLVGG